ncbi:arylesterase [Pedobacter sp. ISL-68]|uniref:arylesterase n=1 Tax=unclassified Pedobacter TaxID=2628915 RepID=UPI001BE8DD0F|nr:MULTISPECIES: arylesterase [unclassified Pedobacter]MBT2564375.1 arylesterase [Pedobacter sp. ISL-64]MBT2593195.1 arylesterase [Pedobacter sp. ISL-68]
MLRKRLMGLFVLSLVLLSCGNRENKSNTDKTLDSTDQKTASVTTEQKNILFFGTSLTAGYGLDPTEAYPALIQNRIDSLQMPYKVINGGLSGETSAGGKGRIDWLLKQRVDIFVLELGANDGLRGLPVSQTIKNLQAIIDRVKAKYPDAKMVLAGMQVPPNMGAKYAADFKNMFPDLAKKNQMALIPFLLDKVGGVPTLNQADGIHPTAEGDKILAENVWVVLKDLL